MTSESDIPNMHRFPFGDDVVDRLLSGSLTSTTAPDAYRSVAALFETATGPATSAELAQAGAFAATAATAVLETMSSDSGSRNVIKKLMTAKAAAVATTLALGFGTAAAAATGSLPGQSSHATVGMAIAASHQSTTSSSTTATTSNTPPVIANTTKTSTSSILATGPANQHAQFGLCTAFLNGQSHITTSGSTTSLPPQYSSTAFKALIAQNGTEGATATYCHGVVTAHPTSTGSADNGTNSQGKPANPGNSTTHNTSGGEPTTNTGEPTTNTHANTTPGKPASLPTNALSSRNN